MDVETKLNYRCVRCKKVYSTLRGISSHVNQIHNKKFRHRDFELTTEEAQPLQYGKSRSRDARIQEAQIRCNTPNFECVHCGKVSGSAASIAAHVRSAHKKPLEPNDYIRTAKEANPSNRKRKESLTERIADEETSV
ncbi:MAG: hypothetical protein ABFD91_16295 [Anaerohalosphaeraceae bacterium]